MRIKLLLILVVFSAVIVSGCVGLEAGNGVVIKDFYTDFDEVKSGERTDFYVKFKNIGSEQADNVFAELLGLDLAWYSDGTQVGTGEWVGTTFKEKLPNEVRCRHTADVHYSLIPPNPLFGTEGEEKTCSWSYIAPKVSPGANLMFEPKARIYYGYKTAATAVISLLPREEMIRLQNKGESPPSHIVTKSSAPVDISIGIQPTIRVSGNTVTFPLEITINNIGGGITCLAWNKCKIEALDHEWNIVNMKIDYGGMTVSDCQDDMNIPLYKKSNTIVCSLTATLGDAYASQQKTLKIDLTYGYFVDKEISVSVTG
ncbi:MAG: hypothetical protein ABIF08_00175 [Nanoarchaeota archaeon]